MPEPVPTLSSRSNLATASLVLGVLSIVFFVVGPLFAVPALVCARLARRRAESAPQPAVGLQGARAGQVMGMIAIVAWILLVLGMWVPTVTSLRELNRRANCQHNVKSLWCACKMYASDYRGEFPADFRTLVELIYCDAFKIYACASVKTQPATTLAEFVSGGQGDYAYFGAGLNEDTVKNQDRTVLMADKTGNHTRYWNVVMFTGQVMDLVDPHKVGFEAAAHQRGWIIPGDSPAP